MFLLVSHYPDFHTTSCIHAFENYVQSIVLYGLSLGFSLILDSTWALPKLKLFPVLMLAEHTHNTITLSIHKLNIL